LIEAAGVFGQGIGYVDAHLLAAARLSPDTKLWSRDKRLAAAAERLGVAARVMH
jgi:predicted nucleic acid-binding protein